MKLLLKRKAFKLRFAPFKVGQSSISPKTQRVVILMHDFSRKPVNGKQPMVQVEEMAYVVTFENLPGEKFYVHQRRSGFSMSEAKSGLRVATGQTALAALNNGIERLQRFSKAHVLKVISSQPHKSTHRKGYTGNVPTD